MEFLSRKSLTSSLTRKKFLFAGISLAAVASLFQWRAKPLKKNTVKFLTQEGKLVEIDADKLPTTKRTATKSDVQYWIKSK